jgi:prepilin-type N-terminal cleavage/methylation domain-containing protein
MISGAAGSRRRIFRASGSGGFTLIELLIVVAIIAILAAIAVPNFLEAQVRSKVSRAKADMRSVATGLEAYFVDNNRYPPPVEFGLPYVWGETNMPPYMMKTSSYLTTPLSYLTSLPGDVFYSGRPYADPPPPLPSSIFARFFYVNVQYLRGGPSFVGSPFEVASINGGIWMLFSVGPDKDEFNRGNPGPPADDRLFRDYDPTNGTVSLGNIFRTHRSTESIGYQPQLWQNP